MAIKSAHLERLRPFLESELRKFARSGAFSASAALRQIFLALYGERRGSAERRLFLSVAAPLARRIAIEVAPADERIEPCGISVADLARWLEWLDTFEPTTAKIVDLYCVADLSVKETAAASGLSAAVVVRTLRYAVAMLKSRPVWTG